MITLCEKVFAEFITGTGFVYTSPELDERLAQPDKLFFAVTTNAAQGTSPAIKVELLRSNDRLEWELVAVMVNQSFASSQSFTYYAQYFMTTKVPGRYQRLRISLTAVSGTPAGYFEIRVTGRNRRSRAGGARSTASGCSGKGCGCTGCGGAMSTGSYALVSSQPGSSAPSLAAVPGSAASGLVQLPGDGARTPWIAGPMGRICNDIEFFVGGRRERRASCGFGASRMVCPAPQNCNAVQINVGGVWREVGVNFCAAEGEVNHEILSMLYERATGNPAPAPGDIRAVALGRYIPPSFPRGVTRTVCTHVSRDEPPPWPGSVGPGPMPPSW